MSSINSLIEEQSRSHACVPLRPDLQEFYNMIIKFHREQRDDMVRDKRHLNKIKNLDDFSFHSHHLIDPHRIEKQTKIVKNLLKRYEMLPQDNQEKVVKMRDELLSNVLILQKLLGESNEEELEEKLKRQLSLTEDDVQYASVAERVINDLNLQYSKKYLKLLKAAKLKIEDNNSEGGKEI